MKTTPQAKIISVNQYGEAICAGAARISTTQGNAMNIFESSKENPDNLQLIGKVLRSGHQSVLEHAVFSLALWNVSAFVEQFFIEFRLASFTVKSRRYVDFSGQGYHIPDGLSDEANKEYCQYMDGLFESYGRLLELGVPKEDARFLLPYSFHSSFFCTLNARELVRLINAAEMRGIPELSVIAEQLSDQLRTLFPNAAQLLTGESSEPNVAAMDDRLSFVVQEDAGVVNLLRSTHHPESLLSAAWKVSHPGEAFSMKKLLASSRSRELEQLNYTFCIEDLSLPALTHLARHRMQSIVVPPLEKIKGERQLVPESILNNSEWLDVYGNALLKAAERHRLIAQNPELRRHGIYFLTSATLISVITTMNARELQLFIRLRSCNRAQWEIRNVAVHMLECLKISFPELFRYYGPSCVLTGKCPEGKMSCGRVESVKADSHV